MSFFPINGDYLPSTSPEVDAGRDHARKECCVGLPLTHTSVQTTFPSPKHRITWNDIDTD